MEIRILAAREYTYVTRVPDTVRQPYARFQRDFISHHARTESRLKAILPRTENGSRFRFATRSEFLPSPRRVVSIPAFARHSTLLRFIISIRIFAITLLLLNQRRTRYMTH